MLAALASLLAAAALAGGPVRSAHSTGELMAERKVAAAGETFRVALVLRPEPGWHVYWRNAGDSGAAPILKWKAEGLELGEISWPAPERLQVGPLVNYGYEGETPLVVPAKVTAASGRARAELSAEWLVCQEECVPAGGKFSIELPVERRPRSDPAFAELWSKHEPRFPRPASGWKVEAERAASGFRLKARLPKGAQPPESAYFFPREPLTLDHAAEQPFRRLADGFELELAAAPEAEAAPERLAGVLALGSGEAFEVDAALGAGARALVPALGLALLGGLLLNLMPCVFPVLSIKVLGFLEEGTGSGRAHGAAYSAGVVVSFWVLAGALLLLRAQGERIGWGFQLQSPLVPAALAALFVALGLNLLGFFEVGLGLARLGALGGGGGLRGAFLSGALATVVATPCTAPFMGTALGLAVTLPAPQALAIFTALGVGMALPYALLASFPEALRRLPRPGAWMETLKHLLAFPLFATAAWLLWVLGRQVGLPWLGQAAGAACGAAFLAWLWARSRAGAAAVLVAAIASGVLLRGPAELEWEPYSEELLASHLAAGRDVFVDFTAAWCVTCQVNERVVLSSPEARKALERPGLARLKADWTSKDPKITEALERLGRGGVPVYAYHRPGREPVLLPTVLTPAIVVDALHPRPQEVK